MTIDELLEGVDVDNTSTGANAATTGESTGAAVSTTNTNNTTGTTPGAADEIKEEVVVEETDPYKTTREAMANANKSWRQMLLENYNKRQAENKKKVRSAQIVGLGKALGDLAGAIWGGVASSKNNAPAVVPQAQASKTSQQIEQLIREGVVNARDYDNMMLNLAMQEGQGNITLAKALDELKIRSEAAAKQQAFQSEEAAKGRTFQSEEAAKNRQQQATLSANQIAAQQELAKMQHQNALKLAETKHGYDMALTLLKAQNDAKKDKKKKFTNGQLAVLASVSNEFPKQITENSIVENMLTGEKQNVQRTSDFVADDKYLQQALLKEMSQMIGAGLDPNDELDLQAWAQYKVMNNASAFTGANDQEAFTSPQNLALVIEAIKNGHSADDIVTRWNALHPAK